MYVYRVCKAVGSFFRKLGGFVGVVAIACAIEMGLG